MSPPLRRTSRGGCFHDRRIPLVVLYGGGHNREPAHTAKLHAQTTRIARTFV